MDQLLHHPLGQKAALGRVHDIPLLLLRGVVQPNDGALAGWVGGVPKADLREGGEPVGGPLQEGQVNHVVLQVVGVLRGHALEALDLHGGAALAQSEGIGRHPTHAAGQGFPGLAGHGERDTLTLHQVERAGRQNGVVVVQASEAQHAQVQQLKITKYK